MTAKRAMDVVFAALGLVACAPLIVACGLWIKLRDGGPIFYSQWRVGHDGWLFRIHKLRTMRTDAERIGEAQWASRRDPRIIAGCSWMRRSHVDELPQLWNILMGDMSVVGPRPERPEIIEQLRQTMPRIERRLAAKPGLTGLAQVRNGYTNDLAGARRKQFYDLRYLRSRSVVRDVQLIVQTIPRVWDRAAM